MGENVKKKNNVRPMKLIMVMTIVYDVVTRYYIGVYWHAALHEPATSWLQQFIWCSFTKMMVVFPKVTVSFFDKWMNYVFFCIPHVHGIWFWWRRWQYYVLQHYYTEKSGMRKEQQSLIYAVFFITEKFLLCCDSQPHDCDNKLLSNCATALTL